MGQGGRVNVSRLGTSSEPVREDLTPGTALVAGEVVGTVGSSGNAMTTPPHLHLSWFDAAGAVTNPYPLLVSLCS